MFKRLTFPWLTIPTGTFGAFISGVTIGVWPGFCTGYGILRFIYCSMADHYCVLPNYIQNEKEDYRYMGEVGTNHPSGHSIRKSGYLKEMEPQGLLALVQERSQKKLTRRECGEL